MGKFDSHTIEEVGYAKQEENNLFEKVLPKEPSRISTDQKRIVYRNGFNKTKIISLNNQTKFHSLLFKACKASLRSEWFNELVERSKDTYLDGLRHFFDWINSSEYSTDDKNRYDLLKDYETYVMNEKGSKKSPLPLLKTPLREGLVNSSLKHEDRAYILRLISLSKEARGPEPNPPTLNNWFDMPWMRSVIGEQQYLSLESPRILMNSFRITVATTLIWLLEQRILMLKTVEEDLYLRWNENYYNWSWLLFKKIAKIDEHGEPLDDLTELALIDLVSSSALTSLKEGLIKSGSKNINKKIPIRGSLIIPWAKPIILNPDYKDQYSPLEELLCAWLAACETIQPWDIPKLKKNNYARDTNHLGRLIAMECSYFKGRSGTLKTTGILMGGDVWTRALDMYLSDLSSPELFASHVGKAPVIPTLSAKLKRRTKNTKIGILLDIWQLDSFQKKVHSEFERTQASPVFLSAMLALKQGGHCYRDFTRKTGKGLEEYRASKRPLPIQLFTLTHIKNTSVHAKSDQYREADLVNQHSHTSLTEKIAYMTDKNKEWVNQAGRITRLVLNDLQHVVFQPSVTFIKNNVQDLELRTKLVEATNNQDISVNSLKDISIEIESNNTFVVIDTTDSALYLLHYITQVEDNFHNLLSIRPDMVERSLIIKLEWATRTLSRMKSAASARQIYSKMASHLPPLFEHLLETIE